ncbi:MAG: hydroxymethylbilane synthase [Myxococcales bacterium]|nr:hydroxymethylbilane synthase [Myxococcales bacterium]
MRPLRIATRKSPLALWQARHVASLIQAREEVLISLVELTTEGDRFLSAPLSQVGGKGLFVKEIEQSLLDGRADLAVHSLKDMTSEIPAGLTLACVPPREDPRDAFVSARGWTVDRIPKGERVGTSSLRRSCQLLARRPDLSVVALRGNVQSRLRKAEEQGLAGTVLALAGLRRLGLEAKVTEVLAPEVSLPAVGQGVLALECRAGDGELLALLDQLEDATTRIAVTAERAFLGRLEGGCTVPLAGHAVVDGPKVRLRGLIGKPDGTQVVRGEREGPCAEAERIGRELAGELLGRGGAEILEVYGRLQLPAPES